MGNENTWLAYTLEIIVGLILLIKGQSYILLLFLYLLLVSYHVGKKVDYVRKMLRVYRALDEIKLSAIIKKLKITRKDLKKAREEYKEKPEYLDFEEEAWWERIEKRESLEKKVHDFLYGEWWWRAR